MPTTEKTYIVFASCLRALFRVCIDCKRSTKAVFSTIGSLLHVTVTCSTCELEWSWNSQPYVNGIPQGNLMMSASILFSGSLPTKALRVFQIMSCSCISNRTFFDHQKKYLHPAINNVWKEQQTSMLTLLQVEQKPLKLGGDGRCDSPGFCAKYGSYSFMEIDYNVVLDVEIIQVNNYVTHCIECVYS